VAGERVADRARRSQVGDIPEPYGRVGAAGRQPPAVRGEPRRADVVRVPDQRVTERPGSVRSARSQRITFRSLPVLTSVLPPGENATQSARLLWPVSGVVSGCALVGSVTSHSRTVESAPAVASVRPSGENASACTVPWWLVRS